MPLRIPTATLAGLLFLNLAVAPSAGQSPAATESKAKAKPVDSTGRAAASATIETIMETAVINIAARYNLNEAQTQKTREIMTRDVHRFLKEHEAEVWPLIRDLIRNQFRPPDSKEDVRRIGQGALPLVELAKEAILKGNKEWRENLNDEQRRLHDFDLAQMEETFAQIESNFNDWAQGRPKENDSIFPKPAVTKAPPRPKLPRPNFLPTPEIETFQATVFHTYVEEFIKDYGLNPAQVDAARSILKEFIVKVEDFRTANTKAFAKLSADLKAARKARDIDKIKEAEQARKQQLEPVYTLFDQMDQRLKALLTTAQIERHASREGGTQSPPGERPVARKTPAEKQVVDKGPPKDADSISRKKTEATKPKTKPKKAPGASTDPAD